MQAQISKLKPGQNDLLKAWVKLDSIIQQEEQDQEDSKKLSAAEKRLLPKKKKLPILNKFVIEKRKPSSVLTKPVNDARDIKDIRDLRDGNFADHRSAIPKTIHLRERERGRGKSATQRPPNEPKPKAHSANRRPESGNVSKLRSSTPLDSSRFTRTFDRTADKTHDKSLFAQQHSFMQTTFIGNQSSTSRMRTPIRLVRQPTYSEQMERRFSPKMRYQTQTTILRSIPVEQIEQIYQAKCIDNKNEFNINQRKHFIDRFYKNCRKKILCMEDQNLGPQSTTKIAEILEDNDHFVRLQLSKNFAGNLGAKAIAQALKFNTNIIHLDVSSNNIGPEGAAAIFEMLLYNNIIISVKLNSYEGLNRNRIDAEGMLPLKQVLKDNQILQFLDLSGSSISLEGLDCIIEGIKDNESLISLNISNNDLTSKCCVELAQAISQSSLQELMIADNRFYDKGVLDLLTMFSKLVERPSILECLDISGCKISMAGASKIFETLVKNRTIRKLIMNRNNFSGKSFQSLITLLWENNILRYLSLEDCRMGYEGGDAIAVGLQRNKTLMELHLGKNRLGDNSMAAIAKALQDHPRIKSLNINGCKIADDGGKALAEMIKVNHSIQVYDFRDNQFFDESGMHFADAVKQNDQIRKLLLDNNPMSFKYSDDIKRSVQLNVDAEYRQQTSKFTKEIGVLKEIESTKFTVGKQLRETEDNRTTANIELEDQKLELQMIREEEHKLYSVLDEEYDSIWKEVRILDKEYDDLKYEIQAIAMTIEQEEQFLTKHIEKGGYEDRKMQMQVDDMKSRIKFVKRDRNAEVEKLKKELEEQEKRNMMHQSTIDSTTKQIEALKESNKESLKKNLLEFNQIGDSTPGRQSTRGLMTPSVVGSPSKIDRRNESSKKLLGKSTTTKFKKSGKKG